MENHPIPQDVTGFQFKLIGDMTVKQFAYVAAGAILAFVFFYAPASPFIKLPLGIFFGLLGAGLAFLPIEGRPADSMMGYFLKALVSPNQYAYHKLGGSLSFMNYQIPHIQPQTPAQQKKRHEPAEDKSQKLQQYLSTVQHASSPLDQAEQAHLQQILAPLPQSREASLPNAAPATPAMQQPQASLTKADAPMTPKAIEEEEANLALQASSVKYELDEAKDHEAKEKDPTLATTAHAQVLTLEKKLQELLGEKQKLEEELDALRTEHNAALVQPTVTQTPIQQAPSEQLADQVTAELAPTPAPQTQPVEHIAQPAAPTPSSEPTVRKIPANMAKSIGLPRMPEVPNLIVGIVKDPRGNVLQNILVEVKDKDGIPARAFRTNSLGQFASATPLSTGTYTMEFEDPKGQAKFDVIEIEAKGEIMLPLEITSHDEREDLRKALFS